MRLSEQVQNKRLSKRSVLKSVSIVISTLFLPELISMIFSFASRSLILIFEEGPKRPYSVDIQR